MERYDETTEELIDLGDVNIETKGPLNRRLDEMGGIDLAGLNAD